MSTASLLRSLFRYKRWADEGFLDALARVDAQQHAAPRHLAVRLLNHIHVVDTIFAAHLAGRPHGHAATNTVETPTLDALRDAMLAQDQWYLDYVEQASPGLLPETLEFVFTDGAAGSMSREEMLMHVVTHGAYHRGAVGQCLNEAQVAPPRDIFTGYLHMAEPLRRGGR